MTGIIFTVLYITSALLWGFFAYQVQRYHYNTNIWQNLVAAIINIVLMPIAIMVAARRYSRNGNLL